MSEVKKILQYHKGHIIIAGVPKCGTSSLYKYMVQHPNIIATQQKELDYLVNTNKHLSYDDYLFNHLLKVPLTNNEVIEEDFYTIDASPAYFYFAFERDSITIAREMAPDAKLIFVFRNPVDRLYSNYHMNKNIRTGERSLQGVEFRDYWRVYAVEPRQRVMSDYVGSLKKWEEAFPKENMLLLLSEGLFQDPFCTLERVYGFLGLKNHAPRDLKPIVPTGKGADCRDVTFEPGANYKPLEDDLRFEVTSYFRDTIIEFTEYTGIATDWLFPTSSSAVIE